ncbi:uncharacterized protein LOC135367822 isoform X1 [Ornithodoros turicata]|uniref:uncharacterized protein LOC135367822 isoform X1 n=1 Tax=Ornithodoros turicata TaxID=34597 RepID=UPI003139D4F5
MHSLHLNVTWLSVIILFTCVYEACCIKCYQCSTSEDPKGEDHCGAYAYYDKRKNTPVECLGEEAHALGTFCYKRIMQGPRGFIWDGRWRSVERRCAQISERGVNWGCDWGYDDNGVYWEECYCAEDGCNGATSHVITPLVAVLASCVAFFRYLTS